MRAPTDLLSPPVDRHRQVPPGPRPATELNALLAAVQWCGRDRCLWFNEPVLRLPHRVAAGMTPEQRLLAMTSALQETLYAQAYCCGGPRPMRQVPGRASDRASPFALSLGAWLKGHQVWEGGWRRVPAPSQPDGHVPVIRGGLTLWVQRGDTRPANAAKDSGELELKLPRLRRRFSPGFVFALGQRDLTPGLDRMLRIYWHLTPGAASRWMESCGRGLDALGIGHHLKVLDEPGHYHRCDAGVLYLAHADYAAAMPVLRELHAQLAPQLRAEVPAWTAPLARGVGGAFDPVNGSSFGQHRCQVLAAALVDAHNAGRRSMAQRLEHVASFLRSNDVDPDCLYRSVRRNEPALAAWSSFDA